MRVVQSQKEAIELLNEGWEIHHHIFPFTHGRSYEPDPTMLETAGISLPSKHWVEVRSLHLVAFRALLRQHRLMELSRLVTPTWHGVFEYQQTALRYALSPFTLILGKPYDWAWQPLGPGEDFKTFTLPGSHYRGFPVVKVSQAEKDLIQGGGCVQFGYKKAIWRFDQLTVVEC